MRSIVRIIDSISEFVGKLVSWGSLVLVMALVYEVTARYVFNRPTIWAHVTTPMIGFTIIALGWAYVHRHKGHIRLDLFYVRLSPRGQACVDVICTLLVFFPVIIILAYISAAHVWYSWSIGERLTETYLYPPATPIRLVLFLGLSLFLIQGVAEFIRDSYMLIKNKPL